MLARCYRPSTNGFERWGGRGIRVCQAWRDSFTTFFSDVGTRPSDWHSLDRINPDGHYTPANVRWATRTEQQNNQSEDAHASVAPLT